ncbi:MAG: hypothetical protein WC966_06225 [Bradymonadales bacterium]
MKRLLLVALLISLSAGCDEGTTNPADDMTMAERIVVCSDGLDHNGNGLIDCADRELCDATPICKDGQRIAAENTEEMCQDGYDNDLNGKADCADEACASFSYCENTEAEDTEEKCKDGIDNDKNGNIDCDDAACARFEHCREKNKVENTPELCRDGIDNNENGKIDCDDDDCKRFAHCQSQVIIENTEELCSDKIDNDANGKTDCDDLNCANFAHCKKANNRIGENTAELCKDGADNDGDGMIDCDDPECSEFQHCMGRLIDGESSEADCKDGKDNDGDGFIDCQEGACQQYAHCKDACPSDPFKFVADDCECGFTKVVLDEDKHECAKNISSKEEFIAFSSANTSGILKMDIDLGTIDEWTPLFYPPTPFGKYFFGNHKRITGDLSCKDLAYNNVGYCGLFGSAAVAHFRDLDLALTIKLHSRGIKHAYIGGLLADGRSVTIDNVNVSAKVYVSARGDDKEEEFCKSRAVAGALAGSLTENSKLSRVRCSGSSSSRTRYTNTAIAGAVVGELIGSTMDDVYTSAPTTAYVSGACKNSNSSSHKCCYIYAGGAVGYAKDSQISNVVVEAPTKGYNSEYIVSYTHHTIHTGGAVAYQEGGSLKNLHVRGRIETMPEGNYGYNYTGGVAGYLRSTKLDGASFKGSVNVGSLPPKTTLGAAGGIVGSTWNTTGINLDSMADLHMHATTYFTQGGLIGSADSSHFANAVAKTRHYFYNTVEFNDGRVAGLVAYAKDTTLVNTYAKSSAELATDAENNPVSLWTVGALVAEGTGSFLYESYWFKDIADKIITKITNTNVDSTCLRYELNGEGANARPVPEYGTKNLLGYLNYNLGIQGVVSIHLPSGNYVPWVEVAEEDGIWPRLNFDATESERVVKNYD